MHHIFPSAVLAALFQCMHTVVRRFAHSSLGIFIAPCPVWQKCRRLRLSVWMCNAGCFRRCGGRAFLSWCAACGRVTSGIPSPCAARPPRTTPDSMGSRRLRCATGLPCPALGHAVLRSYASVLLCMKLSNRSAMSLLDPVSALRNAL